MATIAHAFPTVKPAARKPARRIFGLGIFPQREARLPVGPSDADRAWAAYHLNAGCTDYDVVADPIEAEADRMAEEASWQESYERGHLPC